LRRSLYKENEMIIYIGNLSAETSENELSDLFKQYGQVTSVNIMRDEVSGGALGFAFVEMPGDSEASEAIAGLNRTRIGDRVVMVCETSGRIERRHSVEESSLPTHGT
jgi:RNA recognition motif-containing protein